jgi:hypothetical protein
MVRLYHGTSSKRASKIVGNVKYQQEGFKYDKYDCVFFAEELETAKFFGGEKALDAAATAHATGNEGFTPKRYTVIEFTMTDDVAEGLRISEGYRKPLGEYTGMSFPDIFGGTGHERILAGVELIVEFNRLLSGGKITARRLAFGRSPKNNLPGL